ncbi:MAG: hypothetical protein FWD03_04415 [Defluviitaleaceae bacterium]|nr:hypothetical protein [Defluviitaleaceae bacterium]
MENDLLKLILSSLNNLNQRFDTEFKNVNDRLDTELKGINDRLDTIESDLAIVKAQQAKDSEMLEIIIGQTAVLTLGQESHGREIERLKIS